LVPVVKDSTELKPNLNSEIEINSSEVPEVKTPIANKDSLVSSVTAGEIIYQAVEVEKVTISFEFELDQSRLLHPVKLYLNDLAIILKDDDYLTIEVVGHTDQSGPDEYNMELSIRRAKAIKQYLISLGIPSSRIMAIGKGEQEPIPGGSNFQNRRVELFIYR